jgi:hypothetical protein
MTPEEVEWAINDLGACVEVAIAHSKAIEQVLVELGMPAAFAERVRARTEANIAYLTEVDAADAG